MNTLLFFLLFQLNLNGYTVDPSTPDNTILTTNDEGGGGGLGWEEGG